MQIIKTLSFLFLILFTFFHRALAFGELGHQLVAALAQDLLTAKAKTQVQGILNAAGGGESAPDLIQIAIWADKIRNLRPETAAWHYVNLQIDGPGYDSNLVKAPNVVTALKKQQGLLGQASSDRYVREEALKWVVHLMGDLHQPLHVGEDQDKGGNLVKVKVNRRTYRLHEVWDYVLLEKQGLNFQELHRKLNLELKGDPAYILRNRKGTLLDWVNASHLQAKACYTLHGKRFKKGINLSLDQDYIQTSTVLVFDQIKKAGIRLAMVLNSALDPAGAQNALLVPSPLPPGSPPPFDNSKKEKGGQMSASSADKYAWSMNSRIYHFSNCRDLERIKKKNLRKGPIPPPQLKLHPHCPI